MRFSAASVLLFSLSAVATVQAQFNAALYPLANEIPPVNSTEVQAWLKELNLAGGPTFPLHVGNPPACTSAAILPNQCWWTCDGCASTDITVCGPANAWGLTFDDGPTPNTPGLLDFLKAQNAKATFFVMGTNVVRNPEVLKREAAEGHHIASHTWSHHALTTLTNEQIVAEIKWTEKAVFELTGLKMKYIRPPYGDIDNRVRFVLAKMGYTVVDWTSDAFDSKDYSLNAAPTEANLASAITNFTQVFTAYAAAPGTSGVITLEHDLYPVTVEFAKRFLPIAKGLKLNPQSVAQCVGDANPYQAGSTATSTGANGKTTTGSGSGSSSTGPAVKTSGASSMLQVSSAAAGLAVLAVLGLFA